MSNQDDQHISVLDHALSLRKAHEKHVQYIPSLRKITDSVLGAIFLKHLMFLSDYFKQKPFYQFNSPCDNPAYIEGNSWTEALGFSRYELEGARSTVATKIKSSEFDTKKHTQVFNYDNPEIPLIKNAQWIAVYWTDRLGVTHYFINQALLNFYYIYAHRNYDPEKLYSIAIELEKQHNPAFPNATFPHWGMIENHIPEGGILASDSFKILIKESKKIKNSTDALTRSVQSLPSDKEIVSNGKHDATQDSFLGNKSTSFMKSNDCIICIK